MSRASALKNLGKQIVESLTGKGRLDSEKGLDKTLEQVRDRPPQSIEEGTPQLPETLPEGLGGQLVANPEMPEPTPGSFTNPTPGANANTPLTVTPFSEADGRSVINAADQAPEELSYSNLNRARIQTEEDVGGIVDELIRVKKVHGEEIGPTETFEGVRERAGKVKWRQITDKANSKTPLNIEELRYAREVEADLLDDLRTDAIELKEKLNQGALSPEEEFQFREKAAKVAAISRYISGEKRRTAQILSSLRDTAGNQFLRGVQRDEFLSNMNTFGSATKIDNYLGSIIAANTVEQAVKAADPYKPVKLAGRFLSNVWFNNVLSKFAVVKAGVGGVVLSKGLFPYEAFVASQIGRSARLTGEDRSSIPAWNRQVADGEALVELMGFFQSLKDAAGPIVKHIRDPEYNLGRVAFGGDDTLTTNLARKGQSPLVNALAQTADFVVQNGSRRLLAITDMMVKSMAFQQKVKGLAYRIAVNEGITDFDALKARMNEVIEEMDDEMFERAFVAGQDATLTQRLSTVSEGLVKGIQKVPFLKFFAPFTRTMLAGTELALERLPGAGMMMPRTKEALKAGGAARDEAIAKQIVGMQIIGLGAFMGMNGEAYSGAMLSKDEQYSRMQSDIYPNSIVTEDGAFQIAFLSPVHELLFTGVMMGEIYSFINEELTPDDPRYKSNVELLVSAAPAAAWTFVETTLTTSIGRNIRELLQAMDDPARYGEKKTVGVVAPMFGVWGSGMARRMTDPTRRRQPKGTMFEDLLYAIKNQTPGLSDELPPAVGLLGEERPNYSMVDLFNYRPNPDEALVWDMLQRNSINLRLPRPETSFPAGEGRGVPMHLDKDFKPEDFTDAYKEDNPEAVKPGYAYYLYSTIRGRIYKDTLRELAKSQELLDLPEGPASNDDMIYTQGDFIEPFIRKANQQAKEMFLAEITSGMKDYGGKVREMMERPQERKGFVTPNVKREAEQIRSQQPRF